MLKHSVPLVGADYPDRAAHASAMSAIEGRVLPFERA